MVLALKLHHISSIPFAPQKPQTILNNHPRFQPHPIPQPNFSRFQLKSTRKNPNNRFRASSCLEASYSNGGGGGSGGGGGVVGGEDPGREGGGGDEEADERFNLRWLLNPDREYLGALAGPLRWVCAQVTWHLFSAMKEFLLALSWSISAGAQFITIVATTIFFCLCVSFCLGLYFWL